jgi:hypothetical protein
MTKVTHLSCRCGKVHLEAVGDPIVTVECCCNSCRGAAARFATLPGASNVATAHGTIGYVMQRKDRIRFTAGVEHLREYRLTAESHTRRVVATCCNTPLFTEFKGGHWLSLYSGLWPQDRRPPLEMRTMAADLADPSVLPNDVPNMKGQSGGFFAKLLWAWIAMGFRVPRIDVPGEPLRI